MRVSSDFVMREIAGEIMLIPVNTMSLKYNGLITLNEVSKTLWNCLQQDCSLEDLVEALVAEYEVTEELARKDAQAFVDKMKEMELLL